MVIFLGHWRIKMPFCLYFLPFFGILADFDVARVRYDVWPMFAPRFTMFVGSKRGLPA
jgi:hypothetical protein